MTGRRPARRRTRSAPPLSTNWSASSSEANSNWRASDKVPSPASASRLLPSTSARGGAEIVFLAVAAGDPVGAAGDGQVDLSHQALRLADQLVELGNRLADLGAQLFVARLARPGGRRARVRSAQAPVRRDPKLTEAAVVHQLRATQDASGQAGKRLTLHRSPAKGTATSPPESLARGRPHRRSLDCSRPNADLPMPSAPWRWMRSKPPTAAIPGMPMGMADAATALFTRHLKYDPADPALARPRPLRPVGRPWLDADLCAALPDRLRAADARRHQALPPARQPVRRPSGEFRAGRSRGRPPGRLGRAWRWRSGWRSPSAI